MREPLAGETPDRRRRWRFKAREIRATLNGRPVEISDLSLTGLGFTSSEALKPNQRVTLRLRTRLETLTLMGRIVWCKMAPSPNKPHGQSGPEYRAGLHLAPLPSEDAKRLVTLLDRYAELSEEPVPSEQEEHTSKFDRDEVLRMIEAELLKRRGR